MKKIFTMAIMALAVLLVFASCSQKSDFDFTPDVLKATTNGSEIVVSSSTHLTITEGQASTGAFGSEDVVVSEGEYKINGVGIGDSYEDFANAFGLTSNNAMWETVVFITEEEYMYNYPVYEGGKIDFTKYDDVFLTVGFGCDEEGKWSTMNHATVKNTWNLELSAEDEKKISYICIIAAGLDSKGVINCIEVDYGPYAEFKEKENYNVDIDYFANSEVEYTAEEDTQLSSEE